MSKEVENKLKILSPFKKSKNIELYDLGDIILKVYNYSSIIEFLTFKGLRTWIISLFLLKKGINVAQPYLYSLKWKKEIFGYKKIHGIELLKKMKEGENFNNLLKKLKIFTKELFNKNIYHKDYDPTNIIITEDDKLYLIDLENVSFFLTKRRKKKMLSKMNRILEIDFKISIDIF